MYTERRQTECNAEIRLHDRDAYVPDTERYIGHCLRQLTVIPNSSYDMDEDLYNLIYYKRAYSNDLVNTKWRMRNSLKFIDSSDPSETSSFNYKYSCCEFADEASCVRTCADPPRLGVFNGGSVSIPISAEPYTDFGRNPKEIKTLFCPVLVAAYIYETYRGDDTYAFRKAVFFEGCANGCNERGNILYNRIKGRLKFALKLMENGKISDAREVLFSLFQRYELLYCAAFDEIKKKELIISVSKDAKKMAETNGGRQDEDFAILDLFRRYVKNFGFNFENYISSAAVNQLEIKALTVVRLFRDKCDEYCNRVKSYDDWYITTAIGGHFDLKIPQSAEVEDLVREILAKNYDEDNPVNAGNQMIKDVNLLWNGLRIPHIC